MNVNSPQIQLAPSAHPLFDQVVADIRPKPGKSLSPITTLSRYLDRARATSRPAPASVSLDRLVAKPLSTDDLTPEERALVAEMGGTVARLILAMMRDEKAER